MNNTIKNEQTILILGATSAIALETAKAYAKQGYSLFLGARRMAELQRIAADLTIRYNVNVDYAFFDATVIDQHTSFFNNVIQKVHSLSGVVLAFGYLGDQRLAENDQQEALKIIQQNYTGALTILDLCANHFIEQKNGFIIGISSVSGDQGRQSNYHYGAAKAAFNTFLDGLRHRLYKHAIRVITVKPGFIDTPMTYGLPGVFLLASPTKLGEVISKAIHRRRDVIYFPWFWRYIIFIIIHLPKWILHRTEL